MITKRKGILRVLYATYYSLKGLRAAFLSEAAVRQEIFAILIMTPVAFFIDVTHVERILLVISLL
ncbi:MAG: diacylglycerol kinase, partial [Pseudomonadota bacterium]|nr:diacylglycerol kinase [Pseudomonadota bacterium]